MIYRVTVKRQNEILLKYNLPYFYSIFVITKFKKWVTLSFVFFFFILNNAKVYSVVLQNIDGNC
jgi:hypothetical protein